jgi:hypothetical protein
MSQQSLFDMGAAAERTGGASKIPAGIHSNVKITKIDIGPNYIDFLFEDQEGRVDNDRHFFPDKDRVNPRDNQTAEEAFQAEVKDRVERLTQYPQIYFEKEELSKLSQGVGSFEALAKRVQDALTPKLATQTVNIKTIPNKDLKYPEFPRYPLYVEKYVEGQEPTLKYSKWELNNRVLPSQQGVDTNDNPVIKNDDVKTNPGSLF